MDGDDADAVLGAADDDRVEAVTVGDEVAHPLEDLELAAVQRQVIDVVLGEDHEEHQVDGVGAFAQDHALRAFLAAGAQERRGVLEVVGAHVGGEGLGRRQGLAVPREEVADLALRDGDQGHLVDAVLERFHEVPAAAQHVRLEARLAFQRDEAGPHGAAAADELLHDPHAVVRNVDERAPDDDEQKDAQHEERDVEKRHGTLRNESAGYEFVPRSVPPMARPPPDSGSGVHGLSIGGLVIRVRAPEGGVPQASLSRSRCRGFTFQM